MPRDATDITILLDRSGSMDSMRAGVIDGINKFIEEQASIPGDVTWTIVTFDTPQYAKQFGEEFPNYVYRSKSGANISDLPRLTRETYIPRGGTALLDAACQVIDDTGARLAALPEVDRPDKVLFVIMTDGYENASVKYPNRTHLEERVAHQQAKYNWKFVYLGANQDAIQVGGGYGIAKGTCSTFDATMGGCLVAVAGLSSSVGTYRSTGQMTMPATTEEDEED